MHAHRKEGILRVSADILEDPVRTRLHANIFIFKINEPLLLIGSFTNSPHKYGGMMTIF